MAGTEPAETVATETTVADARPTETMPVEVKPAPFRQIEPWSAPFDIRNQKITVNDAMDIVAKFQHEKA